MITLKDIIGIAKEIPEKYFEEVYDKLEEVKEKAEAVLSQLGISMSAAMSMYLRQIALQRKIPFEMALPDAQPIIFKSLKSPILIAPPRYGNK